MKTTLARSDDNEFKPCVVLGSEEFCRSIQLAFDCAKSSQVGQTLKCFFPTKILQTTLLRKIFQRDSGTLLLDPECVALDPTYIAAYLIFWTAFRQKREANIERVECAIYATKTQLEASQELCLDPEYILCLRASSVPLEIRCFPKQMYRHPAFR